MGFFDFLGAIGNVFGEIASIINNLFAFLWNAMLAALTFIWNTLVSVVSAIVNVFQKAQTFFEHLWTDYLKGLAESLWKWIKLLFTHPLAALKQLIAFIQKVRKWYDTHILPSLMKQIQMIQRIRQFLQILRILHVKWAIKLDNYLADVQAKIETSIEFVRGYLNAIISWISLITDPTMIIRRNTIGAWLLANLGVLKRVYHYGGNRPLNSAEQSIIDHNADRYLTANANAHIEKVATSGLTDYDNAERAAARSGLQAATGNPLPF